jgi:type VI secretion system protein ImpG
VLGLYNFRALVDRQAEQAHKLLLDGIKRVSASPTLRMVQGRPVRGLAVELDLEEDNFAGEGDMYLFATLLNEFFTLYVTMNSFSQLTVKGLKYGEVYAWPPKIGGRTTL